MTGRSNCLNSVKVNASGLSSDSCGLDFTERKESRNQQEIFSYYHTETCDQTPGTLIQPAYNIWILLLKVIKLNIIIGNTAAFAHFYRTKKLYINITESKDYKKKYIYWLVSLTKLPQLL